MTTRQLIRRALQFVDNLAEEQSDKNKNSIDKIFPDY